MHDLRDFVGVIALKERKITVDMPIAFMNNRESSQLPEFGKERFIETGEALDVLHTVSGALSGDMRYVSNDDALTEKILNDPEVRQQLSQLRETVTEAHAVISENFRLLSARLAHLQTDLPPFEVGVSGAQSKKISRKQRDQMMAERKKYFDKTAHWLISNQFKNWIAPYAEEFIDVNKELSAYCLYDGETFQELRSHTLITQCWTDVATMKTSIARLISLRDPLGEIAAYREASGRAVQFFQNVLTPFIKDVKYREEISRKFALLNITHLVEGAEEIEQGR